MNFIKTATANNMSKICLISAVFGGIDKPKVIPQQSVDVDVFQFTEENSPYPLASLNDRMKAKYFKTQMHVVKPGYDIYIWIDGKVQIDSKDFVKTIVEQLGDNDFAICKHPERNCIYEECDFIESEIKKGNKYLIERYKGLPLREEVGLYHNIGIKKKSGLYNGFIFACKISKTEQFLQDWWRACILFSYYDQFSLAFFVFKYFVEGNRLSILEINKLFHQVPHIEPVKYASKYKELCETPSDINEHLPTLKKYAEQCQHVTEFGVRDVVSTWAFVQAGCKTICSIDIDFCPNIEYAIKTALITDQNILFRKASTLEIGIEETELLFIDTLHNYDQVKAELERHHNKVRKYLIFHDVITFGYNDEVGEGHGLMPAILEFMTANPEWQLDYMHFNNNGLLILKRVDLEVKVNVPVLKDEEIKVSIVIPTYEQNGKGHLMVAKLLNSIVSQETTFEYEVIVSDNSGNNEIDSVFLNYSNRLNGARLLKNHRKGVSENTNYAIDNAKFNIIKPMYQDDIFTSKNALQLFCDEIKTKGWVISNSYYIDGNDKTTGRNKAEFNRHELTVHNDVGMPSCIMFRKSELRFRNDLKTMLDIEFYHQLYKRFGMPGIVKKFVIGQRLWEGSASSNQENKALEEIEYLKKNKIYP